MEFKKLGLAFAAAFAAGVIASACGGAEGGTLGMDCTDNAGCAANETCHPTAKVCVETCTAPGQCPTGACSALPASGGADGGTAGQSFCSCVDDNACAGYGADFTCLTGPGACAVSGQGTDDPGVQTCNPNSTTLNANNGPDICQYGEVCSTTNQQCTAAEVGTCGEATGTGAPTWNKTAKAAPVIMSITAQSLSSTNSTNECAQGAPAGLITVKYYAPNGLTTHSTLSDLQAHVKFRNLTSGQFFGANFVRTHPPAGADAKFGSFTVGIGCGNLHETAAVYIADEAGNTSNVVCATW